MKRAALLVAVMILSLTCAAATEKDDDDIVGTWVSYKAVMSGITRIPGTMTFVSTGSPSPWRGTST